MYGGRSSSDRPTLTSRSIYQQLSISQAEAISVGQIQPLVGVLVALFLSRRPSRAALAQRMLAARSAALPPCLHSLLCCASATSGHHDMNAVSHSTHNTEHNLLPSSQQAAPASIDRRLYTPLLVPHRSLIRRCASLCHFDSRLTDHPRSLTFVIQYAVARLSLVYTLRNCLRLASQLSSNVCTRLQRRSTDGVPIHPTLPYYHLRLHVVVHLFVHSFLLSSVAVH